MPSFKDQRQYQQLAFVAVIVAAPAVTAVVSATYASQVSYPSKFIYQQKTEPAFVPETITVDKWFRDLSEPVRVKIDPKRAIALAASSGQAVTSPFPLPNQAANVSASGRGIFKGRFQYQSLAYTPLPETVTIDKWIYPLNEPVRFRRLPTSEQQATLQTLFTPSEVVTADKWIYPWSEPVRQKIGLKTHLQQSFISPVLNPETQITQDLESRWHFPWSEPVRFRRFQTSQQSFFTIDPKTPEAINFDKWTYPWSEPVRQKPGLKAHLQQALIATTLDYETQIIQGFESRWHQPWSEPVRVKQQVPVGEQQTAIQGPVQTPEFITVDKWIYPWSEPVRTKVWLKTHLHQALIAPVLNPETQITQDIESRWHYPWSEPVRFRRFPTAEQQSIAYQSAFFETINIDKWGFAWSEPVRQKIGLRAYLQQSFIGLTLDPETQIIQGYESRWHYPWSEPVRVKRQVPVGEQQFLIQGPAQTPEFITVDKWIYPWTDPVRQKIGLKTHLQQAFIAPVLNPETQITQDIESRWHYPWSEPVRFRRFQTAQQQFVAAPTTSVFENITIDKWTYPWSEPVRQKLGLKAGLQQAFIGLTLNPETQIIQGFESRWHQPWSEPLRSRRFPAAEQLVVYTPPVVAEIVTIDKWLYPLAEPVRIRRGLLAGLQQSFTTTTVVLPQVVETGVVFGQPIFKTQLNYQVITAPVFTPTPEVVTYDKWGYAWSEPVRFRIDKRRAIALAAPAAIGPVLNPNTQITQFLESRWHYPWSEPKRFKQGLGAWLQQATILQTPPDQILLKTIPWFEPLNEPVRLKIGLMTALQRVFQTSQEQILPDVTIILSATEVNADSAFFGVTVYNQAAPVVIPVLKAVVSIKEIQAIRVADTSIEELEALDNADVSIKEQ